MNKHHTLSAISFIVLLVLFAVSAIYTVIEHRLLQKMGQKEYGIINSELFATFEKEFKDNVPYNDPLIHSWSALHYGVFNSGKPGVVIGRDEWLFTKEEFEWVPDYHTHVARNQAFISYAAQQLQEEGMELIIVPIPAKARVYGWRLGDIHVPQYREMLYPMFIDYLDAQQIYYIDTLDYLQQLRGDDEGEDPLLYMRTDTHWSVYGARAVAKKVKAYFNEGLTYSLAFERVKQSAEIGEAEEYRGDLTEFVSTGVWHPKVGPASETTPNVIVEKASSGGGLFGDVALPIALIGTSYSAEPEWHFADFLGDAFDAEIWNLADPGEGPFTPMQKFLKEQQWQGKGVKMVIWEIPERFLPVQYELNFPAAEGESCH